MQEFSWGRSLATKTIKSIIANGRCNAARETRNSQRREPQSNVDVPTRQGFPRWTHSLPKSVQCLGQCLMRRQSGDSQRGQGTGSAALQTVT